MELEEQDLSQQVAYPRVLFKHLSDFKGKKVTILGQICKHDRNGALVLDIGHNGQVVINNQSKQQMEHGVRYVEVRGTVLDQSTVSLDEIMSLPHASKDEIDFETYSKFVEHSLSQRLSHLFYEQ